MNKQYPLVGNAVWIKKDDKVLLAIRSHAKRAGGGTWHPPGGHLEMFETIEECAVRETKEEAGIEVSNLRLMTIDEDPYREAGTHYITFHYAADWLSGEPQNNEQESGEWSWFS